MLQRLAAFPLHYWQKLIVALLLLWLIVSGLAFTRQWFANHANPASAVAEKTTGRNPAATIDIDTMIKWQLFGANTTTDSTVATAAQNTDDDGSQDAGKTRLPIQLLGLMYANDQQLARAILLTNNDEQQFSVGETLPLGGNIKLHRVLVDRVIISNNGNLEALWLFDPDKPRIAQPSLADEPLSATPTIEDTPEAGPEENPSNPLAQNALQIVPAWGAGGKLQGYRISRGANSAAFDALGFSDGDIITKINDAAMDNPQNAIQLYQQMQRGGMATFEVIRDGQTVTFDANLTENSLLGPGQAGSVVPDNGNN